MKRIVIIKLFFAAKLAIGGEYKHCEDW